jgi:inhibitor of cysteine peptidase
VAELEVRRSGQAVQAARGDRIVVLLPENPTTGYGWVLRDVPEQLELASNEYVPPQSTAPGAGGERRVELVASRPGQARIELALERPWEDEAAERFELLVKVD